MSTIYFDAADIKVDQAVKTPIERAKWADGDIEAAITEAETYIEGCLLRLGYTRSQLTLAPSEPAPLVLSLILNWIRYVILRDVYADTAPQEGTGERYEKWKKNVEDTLAKLEPDKNGNITLRIVDNDGLIINPASIDLRFKVGSNTLKVSRAITMEDSDRWKIDGTQSVAEVVGKKPGER
jgi:hypothetical protein